MMCGIRVGQGDCITLHAALCIQCTTPQSLFLPPLPCFPAPPSCPSTLPPTHPPAPTYSPSLLPLPTASTHCPSLLLFPAPLSCSFLLPLPPAHPTCPSLLLLPIAPLPCPSPLTARDLSATSQEPARLWRS